MSATFVDFDPSDFPFFTTIPDDGQDDAGGWQVAKVSLKFQHAVVPGSINTWYCEFNIEMPLRTVFMGKVDAARAASLSEAVTEAVARDRDMDYRIPPGIFCRQFVTKVDLRFRAVYPRLGATATIK
jgi:hypothetical protein